MKLDFKDKEKRGRFPKHGWATNSEGICLIWLPIMRVLANSNKVRTELGLSKITNKNWEDVISLFRTLENLSIILRELAVAMRHISSLDPITGNSNSKNREYYLLGLIKVYVDTSIMYLRRLADDFCRSVRYVLFDKFESSPREFKKLINLAMLDENKLVKAGLLCDIGQLKEVIIENTYWFRDIRGMNRDGHGKKGYRDILNHHSSSIETTRDQTNNGPWQTKALLRYMSESNVMSFDLLAFVERSVSQLCDFWTRLYNILPYKSDDYKSGANLREGDIFFILGDDIDTTRMWPKI